MSEELKPCPLCGGEAERVDIDEGENVGGSCISCKRCLASSNVEFEFKENFISNWNRRVDAMSEWQPIETAPRDGTDVLLYLDGRMPCVAGYFRDGWYSFDAPEKALGFFAPTHWMPLPSPPLPTQEAVMRETVSYYKLVRVDIPPPAPNEFRLSTAALMCCRICGRIIDGMGGPGEYVCIPCGDVVMAGKAIGAIKWDEAPPTGGRDE